MWHEILLLHEIEKGRWIIYTPDEDQYPAWVDGSHPEDGVQRVVALNEQGEAPELLRGSFYRFSSYPSESELVSLIRGEV